MAAERVGWLLAALLFAGGVQGQGAREGAGSFIFVDAEVLNSKVARDTTPDAVPVNVHTMDTAIEEAFGGDMGGVSRIEFLQREYRMSRGEAEKWVRDVVWHFSDPKIQTQARLLDAALRKAQTAAEYTELAAKIAGGILALPAAGATFATGGMAGIAGAVAAEAALVYDLQGRMLIASGEANGNQAAVDQGTRLRDAGAAVEAAASLAGWAWQFHPENFRNYVKKPKELAKDVLKEGEVQKLVWDGIRPGELPPLQGPAAPPRPPEDDAEYDVFFHHPKDPGGTYKYGTVRGAKGQAKAYASITTPRSDPGTAVFMDMLRRWKKRGETAVVLVKPRSGGPSRPYRPEGGR